MTDIPASPYADPRPDATHPGISWRAVLAGAIVAAAVGAMLNLLGLALGAAALNPFDLTRGDVQGFSIGAGFWTAIANAIALFVGAFVASRASRVLDGHRGLLLGLTVWAAAFVLAMLVAAGNAGLGASSILDRGGRNDVRVDRTTELLTDPVAAPDGTGDLPAVAPAARPAVDRAADATSAIALWAFLTMAAGAVASVLGARYGERRHGWELRAMAPHGAAHRHDRHEHHHDRHDLRDRSDLRDPVRDTAYDARLRDEPTTFDGTLERPADRPPLL